MTKRDPTAIKPGDNVYEAIDSLYRFGRSYPHKPPHDYEPPERAPHPRPPQPSPDEYRATFRPATNSEVSPAPDESQCQFVSEKVATHNDASGWVRGQGGQSPHPKFDSGGSGFRYSTKYRR